ncbi:hypothetical protein BG015_001612 [Linnemannia schmuckeri]|uniref:Uncharacterized protein n=1 Tax=Linnemannia schmuckeri TaxID=64567 RepID=A0A9P5V6X6_9FUNG|nr:hypothetical protein BG015_001612 [Linnemannia schmuckeri]
MRYAIFALVALLAIVHAASPVLLDNGNYRIYYGTFHVPRYNRYATAEPDAMEGSVRTFPRQDSSTQIWRLKNTKHGRITLESLGAPGKYLGLRRAGANPGAYLGVVPTPVEFTITREGGGSSTSYELAYSRLVGGKTLVVSIDREEGKKEPYYVNFNVKGTEGILDSWRIARVSE